MKKKLISFSFLPLILFSCKNNNVISENKKENEQCNAGAGYQWSVIKNGCIRVFEQELQLQSVQKEPMEKICAVIFSKNNKQAEIFLDKPIILMKKTSNEFTCNIDNVIYHLAKNSGKWQLSINSSLVYTQ